MDVAPTYTLTSPELVHLAILKDAAQIASERAVADPRLSEVVSGQVFRPAPLRSRRGGLALEIIAGLDRSKPEKIRILHEIGKGAVRDSILKNRREFVGLIVGSAREGTNYFDRFKSRVGDQMELF